MKDPQKVLMFYHQCLKRMDSLKLVCMREVLEKLKPAKNFIKEIENKNIESIRRVRKALIENNDENIVSKLLEFLFNLPFIDLLCMSELDFDI